MWLLVVWAAALAATVWWFLSRQVVPAETGPVSHPDPYAQQAADFRRELSDWDRAGRPGSDQGGG